MKKLFIMIFYIITYCFSQSIDNAIKGPIPGMTYTPDVGKFNINTISSFTFIESTFDDNGDEIPLSKQMLFTMDEGET